METKHQVHNLIILDESGSMNVIKDFIMRGFNEIVQNLKALETKYSEQEHFITFITFNGLRTRLVHFVEPVSELQEIDSTSYHPNSSTPLYDAMGYGLNLLRKKLQDKDQCSVLVTILTDGEENDSTEYSREAIRSLVNELKQANWLIKYIGTDHDVQKVADSFSISDFTFFRKDETGITQMFESERRNVQNFCEDLNKVHQSRTDTKKIPILTPRRKKDLGLK